MTTEEIDYILGSLYAAVHNAKRAYNNLDLTNATKEQIEYWKEIGDKMQNMFDGKL